MNKRNQFFLSHLFVSICLALIIIGWVFFIWYPQPLAKAVGVTHIFMMMLVIDVILGPLLGFIVYKEKKKTLKFDLSIIIIIQILALIYGIFNIAQARPVWIVFNQDKFELVQKNYLIVDNLKSANSEYQKIGMLKPQFVGTKPSDDINERKNNYFDSFISGISLAQRPERYVAIEEVKQQIHDQSKSIEKLNQFNEKQQVENIIKKYPTATAWLPLKANAVDMVVLINKEKGEVVKIVDLRPWK